MTKNLNLIDTKPQNAKVLDVKPSNTNMAIDFGNERQYTIVINAGQAMGPGFFMFIPYLTGGTVQSPITN